jgi:hypothetical protein
MRDYDMQEIKKKKKNKMTVVLNFRLTLKIVKKKYRDIQRPVIFERMKSLKISSFLFLRQKEMLNRCLHALKG